MSFSPPFQKPGEARFWSPKLRDDSCPPLPRLCRQGQGLTPLLGRAGERGGPLHPGYRSGSGTAPSVGSGTFSKPLPRKLAAARVGGRDSVNARLRKTRTTASPELIPRHRRRRPCPASGRGASADAGTLSENPRSGLRALPPLAVGRPPGAVAQTEADKELRGKAARSGVADERFELGSARLQSPSLPPELRHSS